MGRKGRLTVIKLRVVGPNQTEVKVGHVTLFFSYNTLVAAHGENGFLRTEEKYSQTTTRHINKWLAGAYASPVPQATLERLANHMVVYAAVTS